MGFKKGDKVVCINDKVTGSDLLKEGQVYTVRLPLKNDTLLLEETDAWVWVSDLFKLAPEVEKEVAPSVSTLDLIEILFENFKEFLKEKNRRYGDSALKPLNIFSKESVGNEICNRLDDKLSRIKASEILRKNDVADVFGYVALLLISKGWTSFEDLLD